MFVDFVDATDEGLGKCSSNRRHCGWVLLAGVVEDEFEVGVCLFFSLTELTRDYVKQPSTIVFLNLVSNTPLLATGNHRQRHVSETSHVSTS